jgi:hypothetical protein
MNSRKTSIQFPAKLITPVAAGGVTLLLLLLYDKWLPMKVLNPVYWHPYVFVGSYIVCLVLVAVAFIRGRPSTLARTCLLIGTMLALAFPLLLPFLYGEYQPYAKPVPGYEMQWVTQPGNRFMSAFKSAQREHEGHGCTYTLYGWSAGNVLYYGSDCQSGFWRYDPTGNDGLQLVWSIPDIVKDHSSVDKEKTTAGGGIWPTWPTPPQGLDPFALFPVIVYERALSPDGRHVAAAITEFYGPRDVVILRAKE